MKNSILTSLSAFFCILLLTATDPVLAQDAMFIDANGRVGLSASGQAITDGMYTLVLSIWDDSSGGNMLWTETHLVQTKDGLWNATLGSSTSLPIDVIAPESSNILEARFLQMEFDGELIVPRRRMGGLPFAGAAQRLRGDINTSPGLIHISQIDPFSDTGVTIELGISADSSTGEPIGRLAFYETVDDGLRASSSKPKEIVVVGSKIKENFSYYFDVQGNISDYEFVKGQASGKRTYGPILFSSAVLPDTIPAYSLQVDSNGTELLMTKNNSDGSSCWIRTSQTHAGSVDSMVASDGASTTKKVDKSTPLLAKALCSNEVVDGRLASVESSVGVDSGFSHSIDINDLTSGMHSTTEVDGRDYLVWQRGNSPASSDSVSNFELLSLDSGYSHSIYLTNGTGAMHSDVDASDYLVWRKTTGVSTGSNSIDDYEHISVDSGFINEITATNGTSTSQRVNKVDAFVIKQGIHASHSTAGASEILMESDADNSSLRISNVSADRHQSQHVDDTSGTFEIYQNIIARAKVEKLVMQNTAATGSRLYVGNLGMNSSDGFHVKAELVGGTKVGVNTSSPSAALDVNGSVEIGNGTPITQVLSATATLDFPSTGGGGSTSDLGMSVPGAALGDVVSLGIPAGSVTIQGMFTAWVSAPNIVTIRFANMASSSQNPASGTFRAMLTKF